MLVSILLQLPMPFLTRYILDDVIRMRSFKVLNIIGFSLIGVIIIQGISFFVERYLLSTFRAKVLFDLKVTLLDKIERLKLSYFHNKETGYLMSRIQDDTNQVQGLLADTFISFVQNFLTFIVGICATFYLHYKLAIICLSILPLYALTTYIFNKRIRDLSYELREAFAKVSKDLQELLSGIMIIKAFTGERYGTLRFIRSLREGIRKTVKLDITATIFNIFSNVISSTGPIILIWYGCYEIMKGRLTIGTLVAFNSFIRYLFAPTQAFMQMNISIQQSIVSIRRIFEIMDEEEERDRGIKIERIEGKIEFKNVYFSYDGMNDILKNFSLLIFPGEKIGVVGESGIGKSTIAGLILRFYEHREGKIMIDGIDIRDINLKSLRESISYVSQDIFLFSDTIRENIRLGKRNATDIEIIEAARISGVMDFVKKKGGGLDTKIGERGIRLSGGERQRIAIARAVLKNAPIVILDEATSNLDIKNEKKIIRLAMDIFRGKTMIIITHRKTPLNMLDRIIKIENGSAKEL